MNKKPNTTVMAAITTRTPMGRSTTIQERARQHTLLQVTPPRSRGSI